MTEPTMDIIKIADQLAQSVDLMMNQRQVVNPLMIGIHTGGAWVAKMLYERLGFVEPLGTLDISFYRDDFSQIGVNPEVKPSSLPFEVEERDILLIDDVLYTGRTIRAALNEIFDYGRPGRVFLGVLIERDGRQVPVQADCVGTRVDLKANQRIKLSGPEPLELRTYTFDN